MRNVIAVYADVDSLHALGKTGAYVKETRNDVAELTRLLAMQKRLNRKQRHYQRDASPR